MRPIIRTTSSLCSASLILLWWWHGQPQAAESPEPVGRVAAGAESKAGAHLESMDWSAPVYCLEDPDGHPIRVQCREAQGGQDRRCLFSNAFQKGPRGKRGPALERLRPCQYADPDHAHRYADLVADGYRFEPAIAEAPPGWMRDDKGRVFQVNFDLNRRIWLGARWAPTFFQADHHQLGRVGLEFGLRAELFDVDGLDRYRFQAAVGEVTLHPLGVEAMLLHFDSSHESETPLLRLTTFWGRPARHDLYMNIGGWFDLLGVQYRPRGSLDETQLRFLAGGMTWDIWHDADLSSFCRLRLGIAFDDLYLDRAGSDNRLTLTPLSALEGDFTFDAKGFHHLVVTTGYEAPFVWNRDTAAAPRFTQRFINTLAYEVIVLAINDQPLTFRVAVGGGYRNEVEKRWAGWDLKVDAGLRFCFWAPPRDLEARRRAADQTGRR